MLMPEAAKNHKPCCKGITAIHQPGFSGTVYHQIHMKDQDPYSTRHDNLTLPLPLQRHDNKHIIKSSSVIINRCNIKS